MRRSLYWILIALLLSVTSAAAQDTATPEATSNDFRVAEVLPSNDAGGVATDAAITAIFNLPVVPLGIVEESDSLPDPLVFDPPVEGEGEWLNTAIYVFRPDVALAGGTQYTVTVDPTLEAADGTPLSESFSWVFVTAPPSVSEVLPEAGSVDVTLNSSVQITFNQPMDQASVENSFFLRAEGSPENVPGSFEWNDDSTGFRFIPDDDLMIDRQYTAGFSEAPTGASGGAPLDGITEWSFFTVPLPAIVSTSPSDGDQNAYPYGGFTILFASPMNIDTLREHVIIEPEPWRDFDAYYSDWDDSYTLSFPTEPSTDYTITITPGMEDIYGNTIDETLVVQYTTAPYDPEVMLQTPGAVGFYNAYNEQTQLFLTHRNISRVDLALYRVNTQQFIEQATGENSYDPTYLYSPNPDDLIRQWSIESVAPENQRRYELLDLGGVECPGAPASRLAVGDLAVVVSDPDPVRARASAPDGEILTLLYRDYALSVVGGPICANDMLWWEVELRDGERAWVAEGTSEEYFIGLRDAASQTPVDVTDEDGGALPPGIYYLTARSPETDALGYQAGSHFIIVGTANLTLKASVDSMLVWATDVNTGLPIPNAPVTVLDIGGAEIASGTTDEAGLASFDLPRMNNLYETRAALLQTETQFGVATTSWSSGVEGFDFGQYVEYFPEQYRLYLYTDRPVYRPDQPVYFRGIVRLRDDVTYTPPDLTEIPVIIVNDEGAIVYEETLPITPFGTFSSTFDVAADAKLGYYRLSAQLPGQDETNYYAPGSISFGVAEYRLPEFQVTVTPELAEIVSGEQLLATIDSRYFFGGAVSDAQVEWRIVSTGYYFDYPGGYSFIDFDRDAGASEFYAPDGGLITEGAGTTDAQGMFTVDYTPMLDEEQNSQTFTLEATITDESGQAVSGRADIIVHKGAAYVGVRPENYVAIAGDEVPVDFILISSLDRQPLAGETITVEVVERRWYSVQERDDAGRTTWSYEVEEIPVDAGEITTDENGEASFTFTPPNGGIFKIKATYIDENGTEVYSANTVYVSGEDYVAWRQQNSNRIDLIADSDLYTVGDTAEILITSPFQGETQALVTVERGDVLFTDVITMETNSFVYNLPITEDYAPNVFVSVLIVKGVDENNPVAAFRAGMVQLAVDNEQKEIILSVEAYQDGEPADVAEPGETLTYLVTATDFEGNPVEAEIGVALTDLASLSIGEPNSGPLLNYFYGQQGLSVKTATPLTINTDQITQTTLDTIKGGGGGFGEGGIFDIREEFIDTPYWNATVVTDENGEATFDVTLPDNLTTWRLDARAVTSGEDGLTLVGGETYDLISTKPLLIRPVTPRFFIVGDQSTLAAIVNNNTGEDQFVEVTLAFDGLSNVDNPIQSALIPDGTRQRFEWQVTVDDVNAVDLTFFAAAPEYTDASRPPLGRESDGLLPVYRYEAPETVGTAGVLREAGEVTEQIALPQTMEVTQGELSVSLEPSLAATTIDGLEYLENFPYQCTEQTVSRFFPNVVTYGALASLELDDPALEANLNAAVNFALQRLYAEQHVDGGWGWFVQDQSNALVTAYALLGLNAAQEAGFPVNEDAINNAQRYLQTTFIVPGLDVATWRLNRQAFVLYTLAETGEPDVARTATLYESRDRLAYYAKAYLAMALHTIDPADSRINTLMSDLFNGAVVSATGTHWEEPERDPYNWNTDTRTTAIMLEALVRLSPDSELIPNVVRWLVSARTADAWETTQETAWAVMALTDWMVISNELNADYSFSAALNGETLAESQATRENIRESTDLVVQVADLLRDQANALTISRSEGEGNLYYTAHLRVFLPVPEIEPLNRGIILERRYTLPGSDEPITSAAVGELVQARLTIIVPNDLNYAVIEDPIPAGADAVNPDLATSQQIGTRPELDRADPLGQGWGWWWFSNIDFEDEKVVLYATYLPAGTYEFVYTIRPGLPGVYNVIPPVGYEFYFPEVYGRGAGSTFTITGE
jgi:alpha-2-macroglobulin